MCKGGRVHASLWERRGIGIDDMGKIVFSQLEFKIKFLGAKSTSLRDCVGRSVRPLVGPLVRPHDAITWKTSYVAIASRRGGGRGKLVTSLLLRA